MKWLTSRPGRFTPRERATGTHSTIRWVGPKADIEVLGKIKKKSLALAKKRTPSHEARILVTILITLLRLLYYLHEYLSVLFNDALTEIAWCWYVNN